MGTAVGRLAILGLSLGFAIVLARVLTPTARGEFALLQALNSLTVVVGSLAISGAIVYHHGKRLVGPEEATGSAILLAVISGVAAGAIVLPLALIVKREVMPGLSDPLLVTAIVLAIPLIVRGYCGGVMIALGRSPMYLLSHAAQPFGAVAVLGVLILVGQVTFFDVVFAWGTGLVLAGGLAMVLCLTLIDGRPRAPRPVLLGLGRFGARTYPASLARFLNLRLDQFLVGALGSAAILGQYAVAVNVGELLIQVPVTMLWALSGTISSVRTQDAGGVVAQFSRWVVLILLASAIVVGLTAPVLVPAVFGARYRPAVGSVLLLLPGMVCYGPALVITEYFIVHRGKPSRALVIAGVSLIISTALNFPLTPTLGAAGASIASSVSYLAMLLVALLLFHRDTGQPLRDLVVFTRRDLGSVVGLVRRRRAIGSRQAPRPQ